MLSPCYHPPMKFSRPWLAACLLLTTCTAPNPNYRPEGDGAMRDAGLWDFALVDQSALVDGWAADLPMQLDASPIDLSLVDQAPVVDYAITDLAHLDLAHFDQAASADLAQRDSSSVVDASSVDSTPLFDAARDLQPSPYDLGPDGAAGCGHSGMACCPGDQCTDPNTSCQGGYCLPCGSVGTACCSFSSGDVACNAGTCDYYTGICSSCGSSSQMCCGGSSCNAGGCCLGVGCVANGRKCFGQRNCSNGSCVDLHGNTCGGQGEACCNLYHLGFCTAPDTRCTRSTCAPCGGLGQSCCLVLPCRQPYQASGYANCRCLAH